MVMAMSAGINFYGFAAFFVPLSAEFGWSRGVLSGVFALSRLEGGLLGPVEGFLVDKFGPRRMMFVGIPLMGVGYILLSQIDSLVALYVVYIFTITLGASFGTFAPVGAAVANWFNKRRSRALGIMMSGVAVGGAVFLPLLGILISSYGWRTTSIICGFIVIAIGLPASLVMRHKPEQYGMVPDGIDLTIDGTGHAENHEEISLTGLESLRTSAFWLIGLSNTMRGLVTAGLTIHFVAMMVDQGFAFTVATSLLGSVALLSIIGRLGMAWLGDMFDKRYLLAGTMLIMAATLLGMGQVENLLVMGILLFLYAICYGGSIVLPVALQAEYFGRHSFATIRGLMQSVQTAGMLVGPIFAGFVYDATGSYSWAFVGFAAAALLAGMFLLGARKPNSPQRYNDLAV